MNFLYFNKLDFLKNFVIILRACPRLTRPTRFASFGSFGRVGLHLPTLLLGGILWGLRFAHPQRQCRLSPPNIGGVSEGRGGFATPNIGGVSEGRGGFAALRIPHAHNETNTKASNTILSFTYNPMLGI